MRDEGNIPELIRVHRVGAVATDCTWIIEFVGAKDNAPLISLNANNLVGCAATVTINEVISYSNTDTFYEVIPPHLLRTIEVKP